MTSPPPRRALSRDPSFRPADQASIALFVAQLDDQSRRLLRTVEGLAPSDLEWQPAPGRNTAGMLLTHIAMTEVFWMGVAARRTPDPDSAERLCHEVLGIGLQDDGMPAAPDGGHPAALAGWEIGRYLGLFERARSFLRTEVATWRDADLDGTAVYRDRESSREWILYHLLEHFAQHAGQVGLVLAMRRQAG